MQNLIHLKQPNTLAKDSQSTSEETIADWIAMYWSITKRFRDQLDKNLSSARPNKRIDPLENH